MFTAKQISVLELLEWNSKEEDQIRRAHELAINYGANTNFLNWLRECYKAKIKREMNKKSRVYLGD